MRERGTLVMSVVLCSGLAIGSYWLAQQARLGDAAVRKVGHDIDYTADDITLTRMDQAGRAQYVLDASKLVHYYDDDSGELTKPHVVGSKFGRPEMTLRADIGRTTSDGEQIRLFGNAVLTRAPWRGAAELVARSNYLLAYPDREVAETDQPIEIVRGGSRIEANAMTYDNATQKVHFDGGQGGRIREVLEPHRPRDPSPPPAAKP